MAQHESSWTFEASVAKLRAGPLSARFDVTRPDLGLQYIQLNARDLAGQLLAVHRHADDVTSKPAWPLPLADAYIRGDDLVATYKPIDDWPYSPQLYWSATPLDAGTEVLASLSLLISVETHLLDTWPRIAVSSQLACDQLLQVNSATGIAESLKPTQTIGPSKDICCVLHRLADLPISYVEIMPASDFRELAVLQVKGSGYRAEWRLFADFLEKGVIRKARLQGAFLLRENDVQLSLVCCAAMERRPLPLTT